MVTKGFEDLCSFCPLDFNSYTWFLIHDLRFLIALVISFHSDFYQPVFGKLVEAQSSFSSSFETWISNLRKFSLKKFNI